MAIDADDITLILSGVTILQNLDIEIISDIAKQVQHAFFAAEQTIIQQGQQGTRLYIIYNGMVEVQIPDGHGQIKRRIKLNKGAVVGEISLLSNTTYSANIVALTDTTALYLERGQFIHLIERHKAFAETMTNLMGSRMAQNGGINKVGKYELLGKLGEGNMAIVFDAYDPVLEREVAIKMLKYEIAYQQEFLERFEREAKIIASLSHPNIINVIEIISDFSTRFIVMEKLEGQDLAQILREKGAYPAAPAKEILYQLASALQYAHNQGEQGIVHRDIKPSNTVIDRYGNIKLTDFGIAGPPQDSTISIEGTPYYMAPEMIIGQAVDGRADIYALGVMAFHMLTGRPPFMANSLDKILDMHLYQAAPDIKTICQEIDDEFAAFINQALEKNPAQRIADWVKIKAMLKPIAEPDSLEFTENEVGILIRLRHVPEPLTEQIMERIQQILQAQAVDYSVVRMSPGHNPAGLLESAEITHFGDTEVLSLKP